MRHIWTPDEDRVLINTHSKWPVAQQAQHIGVSIPCVKTRRSYLINRGILSQAQRKNSRVWTQAELDQVIDWLQSGLSVPIIGKRLGRSINAVLNKLHASGLSCSGIRNSDVAQVFQAADVARLLGIYDKVVLTWIHEKALKARKDGSRVKRQGKCLDFAKCAQWLITDQSLMVFLQNRDYWYAWTVQGITDPDWREYAKSVRSTRGEWVSLREFADQLGYAPSSVYRWVTEKRMQGVATVKHPGRQRYFWRADLVGFVPPLEQYRKAA